MNARPIASSTLRSVAAEIGKRRMNPVVSRSSASIPILSQSLIQKALPVGDWEIKSGPPESSSQHSVADTGLDATAADAVHDASASTQSNAKTLATHEGSPNAPYPPLQFVPARLRKLIYYFCEHIAPMMVVHDFAGNGYRDIILPLAVQNELLGKAVSAVAVSHLAQKIPHLRREALIEHHAVLVRLQRDSMRLDPGEAFTPYTWATIVILLVGETITGADNYRHLLAMLTCLQQMPGAFEVLNPSLRDFFMQQIKMFELFGFPLSDEAKGLEIIQQTPDDYMEFMSYPNFELGSEHHANLEIMRCAIREACNLYRRRASSTAVKVDSTPQVEYLRQCVLPVQTHTPGAHALVWTYFVAAAESVLPDHRSFFATRLTNLHQLTQFGSIPAALKILDTIWAMQGVKRWTDIISNDLPVLIM